MVTCGMVLYPVVAFARVGVYDNLHQGRQCVEQAVPDLLRDEMALQRGLLAIHGDVQLTVQTMAQPAYGRIVYAEDARDMGGRMLEFLI